MNLEKEWNISDDKITRTFEFDNFQGAIDFVNKVAGLAETDNHHPDIKIHSYKKVDIELSTHETGSVSEKDFALAAKIDGLQ